MSPAGLKTKNDCAGEAQRQFALSTDRFPCRLWLPSFHFVKLLTDFQEIRRGGSVIFYYYLGSITVTQKCQYVRWGKRLHHLGALQSCTVLNVRKNPACVMAIFLLEREELMSLFKLAEKSNFHNLHSKPVCHVTSKVFSISKNAAAVDMLLKLRVTWSGSLILCKVVRWFARNPNWLAFSRPISLGYALA
jgi:hypothetical protein